jgi:hypothetical protein
MATPVTPGLDDARYALGLMDDLPVLAWENHFHGWLLPTTATLIVTNLPAGPLPADAIDAAIAHHLAAGGLALVLGDPLHALDHVPPPTWTIETTGTTITVRTPRPRDRVHRRRPHPRSHRLDRPGQPPRPRRALHRPEPPRPHREHRPRPRRARRHPPRRHRHPHPRTGPVRLTPPAPDQRPSPAPGQLIPFPQLLDSTGGHRAGSRRPIPVGFPPRPNGISLTPTERAMARPSGPVMPCGPPPQPCQAPSASSGGQALRVDTPADGGGRRTPRRGEAAHTGAAHRGTPCHEGTPPMLPTAVSARLSDLNAFHLARSADCATPDALDSPGARLLLSVRDDVMASLDNIDADDWTRLADALAGRIHEIADAAPDAMTNLRWREFTDLAAYHEDLTESGEIDPADLTASVAGRALYQIAQRLADQLIATAQDAYDTLIADATDAAADLGADHGRTAAAWWQQDAIGARSRSDATAVARRVLAGIDECDPEILDQLPTADLSGTHADGLTVTSLLAELDTTGLDPTSAAAQSIADAYRDAHDGDAASAIAAACRAVIADA